MHLSHTTCNAIGNCAEMRACLALSPMKEYRTGTALPRQRSATTQERSVGRYRIGSSITMTF